MKEGRFGGFGWVRVREVLGSSRRDWHECKAGFLRVIPEPTVEVAEAGPGVSPVRVVSPAGLLRARAAILGRWFAMAWLAAGPVLAQSFGPIIRIPIEKVREPYLNIRENGRGKSCGVRLYGEWPAYLNYTNATSYRINTPGLQSVPNPQVSVPPGGRFRFFCYFNGIDTGNLDAACPTQIGEQLPDWYVEVQRRGPSSRFGWKPRPSDPGHFDFKSESVDPEGDQIAGEQWLFGDGTAGEGVSPDHRYTKPGTFSVSLTVTDSDGLTNRATQSLVVPAPRPVVTLSLISKHTDNRIEIDEVFTVRVTVRATEDGVGSLSNLVFTAAPLTIPNLFTILGGGGQTNIGTLPPGGKREFEWTLRADTAGQFDLAASGVRGQDAAGRTVTRSGDSARGQVTALIAGITQNPPRLRLGADNNKDGKTNELDRRIELVVGITNVSRQPATEVKAVIVNDPIQLTSLGQDLNIWIFPTNVPPGDFGTILPGAGNAVLRTNVYVAEDRTYAEASILLQGKIGDTGLQTRGEGLVNVGGETLLEARFDVEDRPYRSGQPVRVFGSLKNVSRFRSATGQVLDEGRTLGVAVYPTTEGNGAGGFVYRADSGGRTPTGPMGFKLAPDEELAIEAIIPTSEAPTPTTLQLQYGVAVWIHEDGGQVRRAAPYQYEVVEEDGWSARHQVALLGVPPLKDPWIVCPLNLALGGYLSCRFVEGLHGAYRGLADAAELAKSGLVQLPGWRRQLIAWRHWMLEQYFDALRGDEGARRRLANEILIDLTALKDVGMEGLKGVALTADSVLQAMDRSIRTNTALYRAGNYKQIAGNLTEVAGENVDMAFEALVAARTLKVSMLAAEGVENTASVALRESLQRQTDELAGVVADARIRGIDLPTSGLLKAGMDVTDLPSVWRDAYGARKQDILNLLQVAKDEGVTIAFRSRSARSGELLDAGLAYNKPGGVSLKTVNDIDRIYLGYEDDWEGLCMLVEPPVPWKPPGAERDALINAYLDRFGQLTSPSDFSKDLRASVRERLETRLDEWPKQLEKFSGYVDDGIDVDFHAERNGLSEQLLPNSGLKRKAQVTPGEIPSRNGVPPRRTFRLQMEGPPPGGTGKFRDITGDIDLLAILGPDGKPLADVAKRTRIYDKLQRLIGIQHGESFTYSGGEKLRDGFLRCCVEGLPGAEAMLAAGPDARVRATYFSDKRSVFSTGPNHEIGPIVQEDFAFLPGTLSELSSDLRPSGGLVLPSLGELLDQAGNASLPYSPARLNDLVQNLKDAAKVRDFYRSNSVPVRPDGVGGAQTYSSPGAPAGAGPAADPRWLLSRRGWAARAADPVASSALEAAMGDLAAAGHPVPRRRPPPGKAGGLWRPADAASLLTGNVLRLAPLTYLAADLPAGVTELPTLGLEELGMNPGSPFFAVGDLVVIDPGGPDEEVGHLLSVQPFTLSRPLRSAKQVGDMVLFLGGASNPARLSGALPAPENLLVWLRAEAGVELNGTNVVSWTDQSRHGFVFSAPSTNTRPAWVANSTSGVPAIRFSGSSNPRLVGDLGRTLTNTTIFTLARYLNTSTGGRYIYAFGTPNFSGLMMTLAREGGDDLYHYDGAAERLAPNAIPGTGFRVFTQVYGGDRPDQYRVAVDSRTLIESQTTVGRAYSAVATNVVLGKYITSTLGFTGDLVEWIVYDRSLTRAECLEVEEYLRQRARLLPAFPGGAVDLGPGSVVSLTQGTVDPAGWSLNLAGRESSPAGSSSASAPVVQLLPGVVEPGQTLRTRLRPAAGDGYIGVAWAFFAPSRFLLFDWRAVATNDPVAGPIGPGMRWRSVNLPPGALPTLVDLGDRPDPARVTLWKSNGIPWVAGREYDFTARPLADGWRVEVFSGSTNLVTWEISSGPDGGGAWGHYAAGAPGAWFGPAHVPGSRPAFTQARLLPEGRMRLEWSGGEGAYTVEWQAALGSGGWVPLAPATLNQWQELEPGSPPAFFRIRGQGTSP